MVSLRFQCLLELGLVATYSGALQAVIDLLILLIFVRVFAFHGFHRNREYLPLPFKGRPEGTEVVASKQNKTGSHFTEALESTS